MARGRFSPNQNKIYLTPSCLTWRVHPSWISATYGLAWQIYRHTFSSHPNSCLQSSLNMANIQGAAISGVLLGESFKSGYKHQNWHEYCLGATFCGKNCSRLKSQDGRHCESQNIRFWIKPQIIVLVEWSWFQIIYFWLWGIRIFLLRDRKSKMAAIFQDGCLFQH